jgi:hypothetical protein
MHETPTAEGTENPQNSVRVRPAYQAIAPQIDSDFGSDFQAVMPFQIALRRQPQPLDATTQSHLKMRPRLSRDSTRQADPSERQICSAGARAAIPNCFYCVCVALQLEVSSGKPRLPFRRSRCPSSAQRSTRRGVCAWTNIATQFLHMTPTQRPTWSGALSHQRRAPTRPP